MRILISGATGFIGSALVRSLEKDGHEVVALSRRAGRATVSWDPAARSIDAAGLEGVDAAVHLAGESLAERWTEEKKRGIRESRVRGTKLLAETLAGLQTRPGVLVSASGVGYYGDRDDEVLTEESGAGSDFLAEVCREWEGATRPAADAGIRVVPMRFGLVLAADGGALDRMLPPFRLGLGARLGSGRQWMSWIALDDLVGAIRWAVEQETLRGAANAVSPNPVTNTEFTRTLARVLRRPAPFVAPALALRLAFGEMAKATLLASQRAVPARLLESGFRFGYPDLEGALRHALGTAQPPD